jgi:N utilization substance protein A
MKSDLLLAVTQLAAERNLPQTVVVSAIEAALASAYKRDPAAKGQDVLVRIDSSNGDVTVNTIRHVVDEEDIEDPLAQVSEEEAQKLQDGRA